MSLRKELRVIPLPACIVAFACYAGLAALIRFLMHHDTGPGGMATWPLAGQLAFNFLIPVILLIDILLAGYIYGDAKRRGMRPVMWMLLAMFVPYFIGLILYFILRDPLPCECPSCHTLVLAKFTFCPKCGTTTRPVCHQCGRPVETGWINCGFCGTKLPAQV